MQAAELFFLFSSLLQWWLVAGAGTVLDHLEWLVRPSQPTPFTCLPHRSATLLVSSRAHRMTRLGANLLMNTTSSQRNTSARACATSSMHRSGVAHSGLSTAPCMLCYADTVNLCSSGNTSAVVARAHGRARCEHAPGSRTTSARHHPVRLPPAGLCM